MRKLLKVVLRGAVQGVGMRPFVARLAGEMGLAGWVLNSEHGVFIEAEADESVLREFLARLESEKPRAARIYSAEFSWHDPRGQQGFVIKRSQKSSAPTVLVLPDIATCEACLQEVFDPTDRRYMYPFTNCTDCGPRFSIIESLPYDRPNTTMRVFEMCEACRAEYENPRDRRFHAQPNACPECGPSLALWDPRGQELARGHEALQGAADTLRRGGLVAIKGLGGFHLFCDARNPEAVALLRERKRRYEKPMAVMFPGLEDVRSRCFLDDDEVRALCSPEAPIVLLRKKPSTDIAEPVAPGNPYLGCFLAYTPLHHILMRELGFPCVATSGNLTNEPMATGNQEALSRLGGIADAFLVHTRPIARRVDDSVLFLFRRTQIPLRRARGFAPLPVMVKAPLEPVLALGGHHKNTVAIAVGRQVFLSQHIGDLDTPEAQKGFRETVRDMMGLWEFSPGAVAVDMHPDYFSTRFGEDMGLPVVRVQHHHAHLVSVAAEHDVDEEILCLAWDGTGWGPDGTVWGGEALVGDWRDYRRAARLTLFRLLGGEASIKEPARVGLALLLEAFGEEGLDMDLPPVRTFSEDQKRVFLAMWHKGTRSPWTSSMGRLFDGVSSLLGLRQRVSYEGQAAIALEHASRPEGGCYSYELRQEGDILVLDWRPMLREVVRDIFQGKDPSGIGYRFHRTLAQAGLDMARRLGHDRVFLSGGCFQNRLLLELLARQAGKTRLYWHQRVPPNDGGLSLGQAVVAGTRLKEMR